MHAAETIALHTGFADDEHDALGDEIAAAWAEDHLCSACETELTWRDRAYSAGRTICKRCKQREYEGDLRGVYIRFETQPNRALRRRNDRRDRLKAKREARRVKAA